VARMVQKMKKFNAGDLSKKPSEVFAAARGEGAIIQHKDRQGKVVEEFVILPIVHNILTLNKSCGDVEMFHVDKFILNKG